MNKKGFTLMELLCVIAILGIIATIASVSILNLSKDSNENFYCAKLELLKSKAHEYGINHELEINKSTENFNGYKSITIKVQDLVDRGFDTDKEGNVINPMDNSIMNEEEIILYLKNNQINVYINDNNVC